jgi:hypothetical protein
MNTYSCLSMLCCLLLLSRRVITLCTEELAINASAQVVLKYKTFSCRLSSRRKRTDGEREKSRRKDFISDKRIRFIYTNALFYFIWSASFVGDVCDYRPILNYSFSAPHCLGVCTSLVFVLQRCEAEGTTALTLEPLLHPRGDLSSSAYNTVHLSRGRGYIYHLSGARCTDVTCTSQPAGASVTLRNE